MEKDIIHPISIQIVATALMLDDRFEFSFSFKTFFMLKHLAFLCMQKICVDQFKH